MRRYVYLFLALALAAAAPAAARMFKHGGAVGGVVPSVLTSFSLVNTSGSTVNTVLSPVIGLQFAKGDVATWPQFLRHDNAANCPYSQGLRRSWSDGSIKTLSVVVRCPGTVAGSATLTVDVKSGGSQPSASARTTTELSNAAIVMNAVGQISLSGTWTATLSDGVGSAIKWIDGDAGAGWIVDVDFKQSGSAHGQLKTRYYTFLTTDGSGGLGGIRFLPRVWQPLYDNDTPAKAIRGFSALTIQYGAGPTTINIPYPYTAANFTWNNGNSFAAATNNYFTGQYDTAVVPVYLTTTGTLPSPLNTGQIYFATVGKTTLTTVLLTSNSGGVSDAPATTAGSGTHTFNPILALPHFGSIFGATTSATYQYIQAGGSLAADATLRATRTDLTYWHGTRTLPPWPLTATPPAIATWSYNWDPVNISIAAHDVAGAGDRADLGLFPGWVPLHFFNQDVNGEKVIRTLGLAEALWNIPQRQTTGFKPINVGDPGVTYTGFGTNVASALTWNSSGYTLPPAASGSTTFSTQDMAHMPSLAWYAYLWSGEPQYLDLIEEVGNFYIFSEIGDVNHRNPSLPSQKYAVVTGLPVQTRAGAWELRGVVEAAAVAPDTSPDGVDWKSYFTDSATNSLAWLNTTITNTNSWYSTNGYHAFRSFVANVTRTDNSVWQEGYLMQSAAYGAALLENTDGVTFLSNKGLWFTHQTAVFGDWSRYQYYDKPINDDSFTPVSSDAQYAASYNNTSISWNSATPGVFSVNTSVNNYIPANGDKWIFVDGSYPLGAGTVPGGLAAFTQYYARNVAGSGTAYTFNLTTTPGTSGGSLLATTSSGASDVEFTWMIPINQPTTGAASGPLDEIGYVSIVYGTAIWGKLLGATNLDHTISDALTRLNAGGIFNCSSSQGPKFCSQSSY